MPDYTDIKNTEFKIQKLKDSIAAIDRERARKKLNGQLNKLNFDQDTAVMNCLEVNDRSYYNITEENFDLLVNNHIEFAVTKTDWGLVRACGTRYSGEIHDNGFFYANVTETNFPFFSLQFFPKTYKGLLNYFGEADLNVDEKGYAFFGTKIPKKFMGAISSEGHIQMKVTDTEWEFNSRTYVSKIIGDFFSGNYEKRKKFLENKTKLKRMIADFRANV